MKFLFTASIFFFIPLLLFVMLFANVIPLLFQRMMRPKTIHKMVVYPYQTSWEEAA